MSNIQDFDFSVDLLRNILWQYNDAPNLNSLITQKQNWYDVNHTQFWNDWITNVFDLRTANEFGLSLCAIILDVPLSFTAQASSTTKIGWGFGSHRKNFERGNFVRAYSGSVGLSTEQKRIVLQLRYFQLTNSGNAVDINRFLLGVFGQNYGQIYVRDNLDMSITYMLSFTPPSKLKLILDKFDLWPRPNGVGFGYTTEVIGDERLLESGELRILEDGEIRLLES